MTSCSMRICTSKRRRIEMPECVRQGWCRCPRPVQPDTGYCEVCEGCHTNGVYKSRCVDARRREIWWCEACRPRYALLAWAEQHRFPELAVASSVIGAGVEMWRIVAIIGQAHLVETVSQAL